MTKNLKTKAWPEGRDWPDEIVLDAGRNIPEDAHGMPDNGFGVRYVRHDVAAEANLEAELRQWLDTQDIGRDNIGSIRQQCFMPWDSSWNELVRDETAKRENVKRMTLTFKIPDPPFSVGANSTLRKCKTS